MIVQVGEGDGFLGFPFGQLKIIPDIGLAPDKSTSFFFFVAGCHLLIGYGDVINEFIGFRAAVFHGNLFTWISHLNL